MIKKIKGLKKAIGDYKFYNNGGRYSAIYGHLMFNKETWKLWVDPFCDASHHTRCVYDDDMIINLGEIMRRNGIDINMENFKNFICEIY